MVEVMFDKNLTFVPSSKDMQLLYFLVEYRYIYLKNLDNIYPLADRLDILENQNLIRRNEHLICLGYEGVKLCGGKGGSNYYGGSIRQTILSKIAFEFFCENFGVLKHNVSDYMFKPKNRLKEEYRGIHNSSILGLVCGTKNKAAVFRHDKKAPIQKRQEAMHLHKIGITVMILLVKKNSRTEEIETDSGITQIYHIPRNSKGYAKIKRILSHTQRGDGLKQ